MALTYEEQLRLLLIDKAAIGGLLLLAGFFLNKWLEAFRRQQAMLLEAFKREQDKAAEERRWVQAREDEIAASRRAATAELAKTLAAGNHNIAWLTWKAKYNQNGVSEEDLTNYDKEMHSMCADLVSARVTLAAIDEGLHCSFTTLVEELYSLDASVAKRASEFPDSPKERNLALSEFHQQSLEYDEALLNKALEVISATQGLRMPSKQGSSQRHDQLSAAQSLRPTTDG